MYSIFLADTVSLVNYTGSLGFGESHVRKLLGQCGTLDVQDCIASVNHLIDIGISERDPSKQFVLGASHGGFLSAHGTSNTSYILIQKRGQ
jgi:dipeptidyl aminopeptidase/acylaminoacyl peptidase